MKLKNIKIGNITIPCQQETTIELPIIEMGDLQIGESITGNLTDFKCLIDERDKLRLDGFDFTFKIGKGIITVRRIA